MLLPLDDLPLTAIALTVFGTAIAICGAVLGDRAAQTRRWREARGRVVRSMVREETRPLRRPDDPPAMYHAEVRYEYIVDGTEYASTRIDLLDRATSSPGFAEGVVARYPEGREVTLYYDPANPRCAVLEREAASTWARGLVAAGIAVAAGALAWGCFGAG